MVNALALRAPPHSWLAGNVPVCKFLWVGLSKSWREVREKDLPEDCINSKLKIRNEHPAECLWMTISKINKYTNKKF